MEYIGRAFLAFRTHTEHSKFFDPLREKMPESWWRTPRHEDHISVASFGEIAEKKNIKYLFRLLADCAREQKGFLLSFRYLEGKFNINRYRNGKERPNSSFCSLHVCPDEAVILKIQSLSAHIEASLTDKFQVSNLTMHPHNTLARIRNAYPQKDEIEDYIVNNNPVISEEMPYTHLTLFDTAQNCSGMRYKIIEEFPLS